MTRVLSALVLLPILVIVIWFLPPAATLAAVLLVALLAFGEFAQIAERLGARIPRPIVASGVAATCLAAGWPGAPLEGVLMAATVVIGAMALGSDRASPETLRDAGVALFALLYLGLPLGAIAAIRASDGPGATLLLLLTVMASDTAQYYGGRLFGRRALAPAVSPKKTVEGAMAGLVGGPAAMIVGGHYWLPAAGVPLLALAGAAIAGLGMAGDLFESLIKRGAGVKDASHLIPGHGGMLDRIDGLLFAVPAYYLLLKYGV